MNMSKEFDLLLPKMGEQKNLQYYSCLFFFMLLSRISFGYDPVDGKEVVKVGVVLDLNSMVGKMAESCMAIALSDFYAVNAEYQSRLALITRNSGGDVLDSATAAMDLTKNEGVQAIIGPQKSSQAKIVIEIAGKARVPVISFSATSPSLSPTQSKYFVRTAQDDSSQVKAIAAIVQAYGWRDIVLIYEDTEYGTGLVPYLLDALQEIDTRVPYASCISVSSSDVEISRKFEKLKEMHKSIFLVHMTASLGSRVFLLAKNAGMMSEGYAWLVTDGLSNLLDPMGAKVMDSMQGVLGVRPFVPKSERLRHFRWRWRKRINRSKPSSRIRRLSLFGLWAYDTVWAIAMAAEKSIGNSSYSAPNARQSTVDPVASAVSQMGPKLLDNLLRTSFQGLSGDFQLIEGELIPSAFEILNVIGRRERIIGYWSSKRGLCQKLNNSGRRAYTTSKIQLRQPIWPGDTTQLPKKLRVGVPVKNGFTEYVKVDWHPGSDEPIISGYCIDLFLAVVDALPFPLAFEFIPYMNESRQSAGSYNDLLYQIKLHKFDAVVGDTTIVANRSLYVDFTLPYSESGISMLVLMKRDERENMWIFLKPLSYDLWLTTGLAFVFTGLVVWALEHRVNAEFRGPPKQQIGTSLWFSFSTLVFAHREKVVNNWTKFVVIIWVFVVLIISQSYTASLASMLTVQRLQPTFNDVKEIKKNGLFVGYLKHSFVRDFLIKQLGFDEKLLRDYSTPEEYHDALSKGTRNGGVAAIFDEIPNIRIFLDKYCSKFKMVGPTYKTDGFAFAFPLGSPLVSYVSRAILNVSEDGERMAAIERKNFGGKTDCEDQDATISSGSLSLSSFGGLFIITAVASAASLLIYTMRFLYCNWPAPDTLHQDGSCLPRFSELVKHFDRIDPAGQGFTRNGSRVHPVTSSVSTAASPVSDDHENYSRTSSERIE